MTINNPHIDKLKKLVSSLPNSPGVYQYYSSDEKIIYIGKARDLKKRVNSYFSGKYKDGKTSVLVNKIADIKHILVETEQDALLLENNLIKKYKPRYNVLLKDDKTFPWICIKNEPFPRVFSTRNKIEDGSTYYGPFTSGRMVKLILDLFRQLYYIRTCKLNLSNDNIIRGKYKVCLEYHLGNCKGPCVGEQSESDYNEQITGINKILKGNIGSVLDYMKKMMKELSQDYKFEKAEEIKQRILLLEKYQSRSTIVSSKLDNIDVFSFIDKEKTAYVNYLKVIGGSVMQSHTVEITRKLHETPQELLEIAIFEIRKNLFSNSKLILAPFKISYVPDNVKIVIPQRGERKLLLDLSERNAKYFAIERLQQKKVQSENTPVLRIMNTMKTEFHLPNLPEQIECFDNSNIGGEYPVASCVVFKNLKPAKREYRHFNIKTVKGPDDFKSMIEVVKRRYTRLVEEKKPLPQLIVIDGGKGQLSSAYQALKEMGLEKAISIIGIAKRLEEIFFPNDSVPLYLDKNSESLKVIQNLRNEAHRFAITFHRNKRSNDFINSELDQISGVGEATVKKLLTKFKSITNIKHADLESLTSVIGVAKAKIILKHFNGESKLLN